MMSWLWRVVMTVLTSMPAGMGVVIVEDMVIVFDKFCARVTEYI